MIEWSQQDDPGSFSASGTCKRLTATEVLKWQELAKNEEVQRIAIELAWINTPEFQHALEEVREYLNLTETERTIEEVSAERMSSLAQAVRRARE